MKIVQMQKTKPIYKIDWENDGNVGHVVMSINPNYEPSFLITAKGSDSFTPQYQISSYGTFEIETNPMWELVKGMKEMMEKYGI